MGSVFRPKYVLFTCLILLGKFGISRDVVRVKPVGITQQRSVLDCTRWWRQSHFYFVQDSMGLSF